LLLSFFFFKKNENAKAYITNQESNKLDVIDLNIKKKVGEIDLGGNPAGIFIDKQKMVIFVSNPGSNNISKININDQFHEFIPGGKSPMSLYFSKSNDSLLVTNWYDNEVSIIDTNLKKIIKTIPVGKSPAGIYVDEKQKLAFVANRDDDSVSIIDLIEFNVIKTLKVQKAPYGIFSDESIDEIFVTNVQSSSISLLSKKSLEVLDHILVGKWPYQVAYEKKKKILYVTNQRDNSISVIDLKKRKKIRTLDNICEYPEGIDISYDENLIIVACWFDDNIILLDLNSNELIQEIGVSGGPRSFGKFILE